MSNNALAGSGVSRAMRAVVAKDVYLSLGLAAMVVALASVMGSI